MSDAANETNNTEENTQPSFAIQKLYVKDISLESPNTPLAFMGHDAEPEFSVQFRNEAKSFENDFFEASLTVTAHAHIGDKTLFLIELTQSGTFHIANIPDSELEPLLGIACPNILFPYLCAALSDLTIRAGFPPLVLQPINFEAIFFEQKAAQAAQQEEATTNDEEISSTKH